jgi:hypothetical protein
MSTQANEPEDVVKDGVEGDVQRGKAPVSRGEGQPPARNDSDATENQAAAEVRESPNKVPGPAEEQDEKTPDDRGLTTDSSPD